MSRRLRRIAPEAGSRSEQGSTLTELLVVMLIMGIIMSALTALTIGFQRTNAQNLTRQDQIDAARAAVERMSKTVRTAVKPSQLTASCALSFCTVDAFMQAQDFGVQFYANLNNDQNLVGPSRVTYTVANSGALAGQLIETVQRPESNVAGPNGYAYCDPAAAGCAADITASVLARGVRTITGSPLLKYYDTDGTRLSPDPTTGALTTTDLNKVLSIELTVAVQNANGRAAPTTYIQRVTLPNAQAVIRQGVEQP
jgi:prepilin-type N-terminal cleavage/methylation domain-containing protein